MTSVETHKIIDTLLLGRLPSEEMNPKHKVLLLSDHPLATSGVGTQARWLVNGLLATGRYTFRCLGGAIKHDNYNVIAVDGNPDFIIRPTNGFGTRDTLRQILALERPDVIVIFTDPRFFIWLWEMEDEIHQVSPIAYNHLWDNWPRPEFNKVLYESTDAINCINWPTYEMLKGWFPDRTRYVPHAVPKELYFPLPPADAARAKATLLGTGRADHFVGLYVGRNARRKMPSDIIMAWKIFMDRLQATHGHRRATLVMHTEPLDPEGANLHHVLGLADLKGEVFFSTSRVAFNDMNALYNAADVTLNRSCFVPGTRVLTHHGFKPIEDVAVGDEVVTHEGRWRRVIDRIVNRISSGTVRTIHATNSNPFTCTLDHKLYAIKKDSLSSKFLFARDGADALKHAKLTPAKELRIGDYLVSYNVPLNGDGDEGVTLDLFGLVANDSYERHGVMHKTYQVERGRIVSRIADMFDHGPATAVLDENMAYVLGEWTADGSTHSTIVSFDKRHPARIEAYTAAFRRAFGLDLNLRERRSHVEAVAQNGSVIARFFMQQCGAYSYGKRVPTAVMSSTLTIKRAYLEGYKAGDGCTLTNKKTGRTRHRIRTVSPLIASQLRQILIDLGYAPSLTEGSNSRGYNKNGRIWTLEWVDRLGGDNGSCRSWNLGNGVVVSRIHRMTDNSYTGQVYDLTVDEDHTYGVESFTVSNCNEGFGLPVLEGLMAGKPTVTIKTGGLTRQAVNHETGEQHGIALDPEVSPLMGNQMVPYVREDYVSDATYADAIWRMYETPPAERAALGLRAREYALKEYSMDRLIKDWDETLQGLIARWKASPTPRWRKVTL